VRLPRKISTLLGNDLRRHTATVLTGSGLAAVIATGVQPILTRLYSPSDFGVADAFVSVVAVLLPFASLKYEDALMVPETSREASAVVVLSLTITLILSSTLFLLSPFREAAAAALGSPALSPWLLLVPLALLLYRSSELAELWVSRSKEFASVSSSTAVRAASAGGVRIGWGLLSAGPGPGGLIWGFLAGFVASVAMLVGPRVGKLTHAVARLGVADLLAAARRFSDFPRFTMPASFVSSAAQSIPFFLLLYYFDEATVGYFGRSFAVIAVPLTLIGSAVSRTFFVHAAEAYRDGTLSDTAARVHMRMVMFAMFPALATLAGGPALFEVVFGEGWQTAGQYARATVVWFALVGVSSPLTRIFDVTERQKTEFVVSTLACVALAVAFVAGSRTGDPLTAIAVGSVGGVAGRLLQLATTMRIASVSARTLSAPYIRYAVYAVPGVALIVAAMLSDHPSLVVVATLGGGFLYALFCLNELRRPAV